jgi:hypothetical protein
VLGFQPVPGDIVNSVGNHLGNDMVCFLPHAHHRALHYILRSGTC